MACRAPSVTRGFARWCRCRPDGVGSPLPCFVVDALALLVAVAAAVVAFRAFSITKEEREGDHHHLIEVGEGRSRFLALCGLVTAGGFILVMVFNTLSLILVPLCAR